VAQEFQISNLGELGKTLSSLPKTYHPEKTATNNSAFLNQAFHLSISTATKRLTILVTTCQFITGNYQSFVSNRCFIQPQLLPTPNWVRETDFGVIGVLGVDYATYTPLRLALYTLAFGQCHAAPSGYPKLWSIAQHVASKWRSAPPVVVQQGLKIPLKIARGPRNPTVKSGKDIPAPKATSAIAISRTSAGTAAKKRRMKATIPTGPATAAITVLKGESTSNCKSCLQFR
jgi:hypothetical protein